MIDMFTLLLVHGLLGLMLFRLLGDDTIDRDPDAGLRDPETPEEGSPGA